MQIYENLSLDNLPGEEWKTILGYEGRYEASNMGRIKSLPKAITLHHGSTYKTKEKILSQRISDDYLFVALFKNGRKDIQSHIVIAETWIPNPENKKEVNHIKGIKTDNRVSELEWTTHQENVIHAYNTGLYDSCSKSLRCLCTGRLLTITEASKEISLHKNTLHAMLRGVKTNWSHYIREYDE